MEWLAMLYHRCMSWRFSRDLDEELDAELSSHIGMAIDEYLMQGLSEEEARRNAFRNFGGVTQIKEQYRMQRGLPFIEVLGNDIRFGLRQLWHSPGITLVAVLTLAIGIGANTAIFGLLNSVLLEHLPVSSPEKLVLLTALGRDGTKETFAYPDYERIRDESRSFSGVLASSTQPLTLGPNGESQRITGEIVSSNYFSILGTVPFLGRTFNEKDSAGKGSDPLVVLSYRTWMQRYASSSSIIGRSILINHIPFTVIGVAASAFYGESIAAEPELWVPIDMQEQLNPGSTALSTRNSSWLHIMGRLHDGVSLEQSSAEMQPLLAQIQNELRIDKERDYLDRIEVETGSRGLSQMRDEYAKQLSTLMLAVILLLVLACTNIASLLLGRASRRRHEMAMRVALGASYSRLMRMLLTESLLIGVSGGAMGLIVAYFLSKALLVVALGSNAPMALHFRADLPVLAFTLVVSLLSVGIFAIVPSMQIVRVEPSSVLKSTTSTVSGSHSLRRGRLIVTAQIAMSLLLLIGAGLFIRTLENLGSLNIGFDRDHVMLIKIDPEASGLKGNDFAHVMEPILERINAIPGVRTSSVSSYDGFTGSGARICRVSVPGEAGDTEPLRSIQFDNVGPNYFNARGIGVVQGRDFADSDTAESSAVIILNEAMAKAHFPAYPRENVTDHLISVDKHTYRIVGVVKDAKDGDLHTESAQMLYYPYLQHPFDVSQIVVRVTNDPADLIGTVTAAIHNVTPTLSISKVTTISAEVAGTLAGEDLIARISTFFGVVALVLASVGLYGVLSNSVAVRSSEIAVRMAMGATRANAIQLILVEAFRLLCFGLPLGLPLGLVVATLVKSQLFGLKPYDPMVITVSLCAVSVVSVLSAVLPAAKAASIDPMRLLRT